MRIVLFMYETEKCSPVGCTTLLLHKSGTSLQRLVGTGVLLAGVIVCLVRGVLGRAGGVRGVAAADALGDVGPGQGGSGRPHLVRTVRGSGVLSQSGAGNLLIKLGSFVFRPGWRGRVLLENIISFFLENTRGWRARKVITIFIKRLKGEKYFQK